MKLSTGKVAFPNEFDNGDKDVIYFNPSDINLAIRLKDFKNRVESRVADMGDIELGADGQPENEALLEGFREMQNVFFEELDRAFDGNISAVVFKHCSPFAVVDGDFFIFQFINAIMPEIEKHTAKAKADTEKMMKHIGKYTK